VVITWNTPKDRELAKMPKMYSMENVPLDEKMIYEHFFLSSNDWFMAEYSPEDRIFFGYAILGMDLQNSEWGNVSYDELKAIKIPLKINGCPIGYAEVERESGWKPKKFVDAFEEYKRKHGLED
jgi:hypothetical protein